MIEIHEGVTLTAEDRRRILAGDASGIFEVRHTNGEQAVERAIREGWRYHVTRHGSGFCTAIVYSPLSQRRIDLVIESIRSRLAHRTSRVRYLRQFPPRDRRRLWEARSGDPGRFESILCRTYRVFPKRRPLQ